MSDAVNKPAHYQGEGVECIDAIRAALGQEGFIAAHHQIGGSHYKDMKMQPWDALEAWLTGEQFQGYLLGTAISYLARVNVSGVSGKGGKIDILKSVHTLNKLVEVMGDGNS